MQNMAWDKQLPLLLLFGAILISSPCSLSIAQECSLHAPIKHTNPERSSPEPALEEELLKLTNQYRIERGLEALVLDDSLTHIAREHSRGMAQQGFISHNLPLGDLRFRMTRAGYLHEVARENVASAPTVYMAQKALIQSPPHESNILANDISRIGIGITLCPSPFSRQLYITEIFSAPREEYQAPAVEEMLEIRIDELRQSGAGSMMPNPQLEKMALQSLNSISMPYKKEELQTLLSASRNELGEKERMQLSRLQASVQLLHNPKKMQIPGRTLEGQARSYGAAVRQITDSQNQAAFLVLTLIGIAR